MLFIWAKQFALLPQAGGYLNTGIGGSGFCSGHDPYNQPYTNAIEIFSSRNNLYYRPFSRMDAGLLFAASLQYRKIRLKVSYELGRVRFIPRMEVRKTERSVYRQSTCSDNDTEPKPVSH